MSIFSEVKLLQKFKEQGHADDWTRQIEAEVNKVYIHLQASDILITSQITH